MSHAQIGRREEVDSRLLVVGSQTASLTPGPSFAHNLGCRCPNCQCEGIFDIYVSRPFQWHQEHLNARCFAPWCRALNIQESRKTPNLQLLQVLGFTPHTWPKWGCDIEELFKRLHKVNMKIHPKECEFVVTLVVYLGHKILPNGIMAHWAKIVAILEMPNPTNVHTLKSFIGLCNYYRIYVQDFSIINHPLYALLKKDVAWTWSEKAQEAFNTLKEKLS